MEETRGQMPRWWITRAGEVRAYKIDQRTRIIRLYFPLVVWSFSFYRAPRRGGRGYRLARSIHSPCRGRTRVDNSDSPQWPGPAIVLSILYFHRPVQWPRSTADCRWKYFRGIHVPSKKNRFPGVPLPEIRGQPCVSSPPHALPREFRVRHTGCSCSI